MGNLEKDRVEMHSSHSAQNRPHLDGKSCANMGDVKISWNIPVSGESSAETEVRVVRM